MMVPVPGERLEGARLFAHPLSRALIEVIRERGYELAGIEEICARSGTSREEFDQEFEGKEEATLRVFEAYIADFKGRIGAAYASLPTWPDNLRAAGWETARWMRDHPEATWFGMVGVLEAGEMARVRREETFRWSASLIEAGIEVAPDPAAVTAATPLIVIGSVLELLRRQQKGAADLGIVETMPRMMYAAVRPYLGEEAARRELELPVPDDLIGGNG
jgi:AcrR family transcriptional regulator